MDTFDLAAGRRLLNKYVVGHCLGKGWEGEVYHVAETRTGIERAAKFFYPERNKNDKTVNFYAKKLDKLKHCGIVTQYHTQETVRFRKAPITFLVSEYVEGDVLTDFVERQRGKRMHHYEAMWLLHALAKGVAQIHDAGEYHGDLHSGNVLVRREGLDFNVRLLDFHNWGRRTWEHVYDDVYGLVRMFYDMTGGRVHYAKQPPEVKSICCGLKHSIISQKFKNAGALLKHVETMGWSN